MIALLKWHDGAHYIATAAVNLNIVLAVAAATRCCCRCSSNPRRTILAVDAAGRVVLMLPNSGHILMTQHVTAGPPLAVNMNSMFRPLAPRVGV
jgi:hypothetical protein